MKFIDWLLGKSEDNKETTKEAIERIKEEGASKRRSIADAYIVSLGLPETDSYMRSRVPGNHQLKVNYKPFDKRNYQIRDGGAYYPSRQRKV